MTSEALKRAVKKYNQANLVRVTLLVNPETEADILQRLESVSEPRAAYLKRLIRQDMQRRQ